MRIVCPSCNATYTIADRKIPAGKNVTATCKKCGKKIAIASHTDTPPASPGPAATRDGGVAGSTEPQHQAPAVDDEILTAYPALRSFLSAPYDFNEILTPNRNGGYKSGKNTFKIKVLKTVSAVLPGMLREDERVVRIAKGTANYPLEVLLGNGLLTMLYNHYAIVCTNQRLLFINIDHRMKKPTHYLFQIPYSNLKKVQRGAILGSMVFQPQSGKKRVFSGVKRALSKEIHEYVTAQMSAAKMAGHESAPENICPACYVALGKGLVACSSCKAAFKVPRKALIRSLIIPGLGDMYLGHRFLGLMELIGSVIVWFFILSMFFSGEQAPIAVAIVLLFLYNGFDALLTFHMAQKGYMLVK